MLQVSIFERMFLCVLSIDRQYIVGPLVQCHLDRDYTSNRQPEKESIGQYKLQGYKSPYYLNIFGNIIEYWE